LQTPPSPAHPESLSGLIERVTFHNEDTGFAVIKAKVKGHRDLVTVVGSLASVSPGEWINAEGRWVQDREFGQQFKAEMLTSTAPTTRIIGSGPRFPAAAACAQLRTNSP
jgi:exodeoxyribonuclease V alpha subunit